MKDFFVSYTANDEPWAVWIAWQLEQAGYSTVLQAWDFPAGSSFVVEMDKAANGSKRTHAVLSPDYLRSAFGKAEWTAAFADDPVGEKRKLVPVQVRKTQLDGLLRTIVHVDLVGLDEDAARERLLAGLTRGRGRPLEPPPFPGRTRPAFPGKAATDEEASDPRGAERLIDDVFDTLNRNPIVLLLAQADRAEPEVIAGISERARTIRGASATLHVTPPGSFEATSEEYFAWLGRQCGFTKEISSATQWEDEIDRRLRRGERLFLLVSRFEEGAADGRCQLGRVLRALSECHHQNLWVVLSGGGQLAALKYEEGQYSILNSAERIDWPEPTAEDVLAWQRREFPTVELDRPAAQAILDLCGGHPRLVRFCLERRRRSETSDDHEALSEYDFVWNLFTPLDRDPDKRRQICVWLEQEDLGRVRPWLADSLLRRLYWSNVLGVRDRRLKWRCDVVREVG